MFKDKLKQKIERMSLKDQIYVSKLILAGIAALGCFVLTLSRIEHSQAWGVALGWSLLIIHFFLLCYVIKVDEKKMGGKGKIFMEGIGTYIFTWLLIWTIVHTIWWINIYGIPIFYP